MKKIIKYLFVLAATFSLFSCSGHFNVGNEKNTGTYITITTDASLAAAKTIIPDVALQDFKTIKLTITNTESITKTWVSTAEKTAYEQMSETKIPIVPGNYDFNLKASFGDDIDSENYTGNITNKKIIEGANKLNFKLAFNRFGAESDKGKINITLETSAFAADISGVTAQLLDSEKEPLDGYEAVELSATADGNYVYEKDDVNVGEYYVAFNINNNGTTVPKTVHLQVFTNKTTTASIIPENLSVKVKNIEITTDEILVYENEKQLTAVCTPMDADNTTVSWSSADEEIVSVDEDSGLASAISIGTVVITATANDSSGLSVTKTFYVKYELTFNSGCDDAEGETATIYTDGTVAAPVCGFSREGYTFFEWNTDPEGLGDEYPTGDDITIEDNTTLYAIWEPNE